MIHSREDDPTIRGPRSALSDYLASQNISISRIRAENRARLEATSTTTDVPVTSNDSTTPNAQNVEGEESEQEEATAGPSNTDAAPQTRQCRERKRKQAEAIEAIKKSKAFKRRKQNPSKGCNMDFPEDDVVETAVERGEVVPGQMENCAQCKKRFTVTPYTRADPNGGLLCSKCGSKQAAEEKASKKKGKQKASAGRAGQGRRKLQSAILDGQIGVKSLVTLCVETLAQNIDLADDLGDSPPAIIDRIARHLAKRRLMNSTTLQLFIQPRADEVTVYDAARLDSDDFIRIFQTCSQLKKLKLRNAIQFKDQVMEFLMSRNYNLESFYIHGANLLSETIWQKYLEMKGQGLRSLCVAFTDRHFSNNTVKCLRDNCSSLSRLKICHNGQVSDEGIEYIANLGNLRQLSLHLIKQTSTTPYIHVIENIGIKLWTFSIRHVKDVDDRLLDALHKHCTSLQKLRITHSEVMTDAGFVRLFEHWKNRQLTFIDLQLCRQVDAKVPWENPRNVGLCSRGFQALMAHSGTKLKSLNVHGCRHISKDAFEEVFSSDKLYPELSDLEISFCEQVTDFIVGSIFRSCPNLKQLNVFGCMKVSLHLLSFPSPLFFFFYLLPRKC